MSGLIDLPVRTSYHKGRDDIARLFYLPAMRLATEYDRAVGFFRSSIFVLAWPALREFVRAGGRIRILCSQVLASEDIEALVNGYATRADDVLRGRLLDEVESMLGDTELAKPARLLAALVARGTIEFQIAILRGEDTRAANGRIFHDKLGIFRDRLGNAVIFKGSMNETWSGLAEDGNLESIDVAASWLGARDLERVRNEVAYFEDLWANNYPGLIVRAFPEAAREALVKRATDDWEGLLSELIKQKDTAREPNTVDGPPLRPHQATGLAAWKANGRRGILAFVTGSGKTRIGLTAVKDALERSEPVMIVVPDQTLFDQWLGHLQPITQEHGVGLLRAGAGNSGWRDALRLWTGPGSERRIVLATVQTASTAEFRSRIDGGAHLMLLADEVHRLGSPQHRKLLETGVFGPRLGLSATPERAGDPIGTSVLLSFFSGVLEPRYSLADAVRDRVLCPYFYRPHVVRLTAEEDQSWAALSAEAAQYRARLQAAFHEDVAERLKRVLIKRARIVKHAAAKIPLAARVMAVEYKAGQRWIIYCEDLTQLDRVVQAIAEVGVQGIPFHSTMRGARSDALNWFDRRGGVLVAIKCLDEGVDLPSVTHALILASSKNPREFIQRRGRVLRTAPGKALAFVHDAIAVPNIPSGLEDPIVSGELTRAVEFAKSADNPAAAADLQQIAVDAGIQWTSLMGDGFEDDE